MPSRVNRSERRGREILDRPVFQRILFAQCWEDPRLDREALRVRPGEVVLSVTSGGCNTLSLALESPARIVSVDLNPAQTWLLELKAVGAQSLIHGEYLALLGVVDSKRRRDLYRLCRSRLSAPARLFWDAHEREIQKGLLRAGRYERYLERFRRLLLVLQGRKRMERWFELDTREERETFYREEWDTPLWRLFFRVFFSRFVLGRAGLDPAFFNYVEGIRDFGEHFRALARHVLVDLSPRDNYFLAQILLGRYRPDSLPPYLQARNFPKLQRGVPRIEPVTGELGQVLGSLPDGSVDAFNLSNIFEWVSPEVMEQMMREIHRVARPGARLCYRNLLVRRRHPPALDLQFASEDERATRLLARDRSFVYSGFEIATVRKSPAAA
jgi:S-adenosylmethionine-diacylglycerol 3-amino-3-carboxypropyl transferase